MLSLLCHGRHANVSVMNRNSNHMCNLLNLNFSAATIITPIFSSQINRDHCGQLIGFARYSCQWHMRGA